MSYPKYQRMKDDVPLSPDPPPMKDDLLISLNPPPYVETETDPPPMKDDLPICLDPPPYSETEPDLQKSPTGSTRCMEWEESPMMTSPQGHPIYSPGRTASEEIPVLQQPKTIILVPTQYSEETYHMPSSFLCCLVPLGSISFCFFKLAQRAKLRGDTASAQRNTKIATILLRIGFGLGFLLFIFYIIFKLSFRH